MHDGVNQIQQKSGIVVRKPFATPLAGSRLFNILSVENRVPATVPGIVVERKMITNSCKTKLNKNI